MTGLFPMCAATLALLGCQQESANPAENAPAASDREYALEVQKLKAGPAESFPDGLAALDSKFGFSTARSGTAAPAGESDALGKTARQLVFSAIAKCGPLPKYILHLSPGDHVRFTVGSLSTDDVGPADPVAMLIRFKNPEFVAAGILPDLGTTDFDILAWNDDMATGTLSGSIDYTVKPNEGGYYMTLGYPYDNISSQRYVSIGMRITRVNCPTCNKTVLEPFLTLGGLVYPIKGGDDFVATQATGHGNPRIYVSLNSVGKGVTNGSSTSETPNARVYPYPLTAAQSLFSGNTIIIDNDMDDVHWFRHYQFKP